MGVCLFDASFELPGGLFEDGQLRERAPDCRHPIPSILSLTPLLHVCLLSNNKNMKIKRITKNNVSQ
jgi:hypothetical protein